MLHSLKEMTTSWHWLNWFKKQNQLINELIQLKERNTEEFDQAVEDEVLRRLLLIQLENENFEKLTEHLKDALLVKEEYIKCLEDDLKESSKDLEYFRNLSAQYVQKCVNLLEKIKDIEQIIKND